MVVTCRNIIIIIIIIIITIVVVIIIIIIIIITIVISITIVIIRNNITTALVASLLANLLLINSPIAPVARKASMCAAAFRREGQLAEVSCRPWTLAALQRRRQVLFTCPVTSTCASPQTPEGQRTVNSRHPKASSQG